VGTPIYTKEKKVVGKVDKFIKLGIFMNIIQITPNEDSKVLLLERKEKKK
jgi:hypothetical protein